MQVAQGGLSYTAIHPDELRRRLEHHERFAIVDARSEEAKRQSGRTIPGAITMTPADLFVRESEIPKGRTLVLLADLPSQEPLALLLLEQGITDVYLIDGGFDGWQRAGGATVPIS